MARGKTAVTETGCEVCWKRGNMGSSRGEWTDRERSIVCDTLKTGPASCNMDSTVPSYPSRVSCSNRTQLKSHLSIPIPPTSAQTTGVETGVSQL